MNFTKGTMLLYVVKQINASLYDFGGDKKNILNLSPI